MRTLLALVIACGALSAQSLPPVFAAAGASYSKYASPAIAAGWISMAVEMGTASRFYSITTVDLTSKTSNLRTGVAFLTFQSGKFSLLTHMDGGATSTGSSTVASFSGGFMGTYEILDKWYALAIVRLVAVNGGAVRPVYELGVGKAF